MWGTIWPKWVAWRAAQGRTQLGRAEQSAASQKQSSFEVQTADMIWHMKALWYCYGTFFLTCIVTICYIIIYIYILSHFVRTSYIECCTKTSQVAHRSSRCNFVQAWSKTAEFKVLRESKHFFFTSFQTFHKLSHLFILTRRTDSCRWRSFLTNSLTSIRKFYAARHFCVLPFLLLFITFHYYILLPTAIGNGNVFAQQKQFACGFSLTGISTESIVRSKWPRST